MSGRALVTIGVIAAAMALIRCAPPIAADEQVTKVTEVEAELAKEEAAFASVRGVLFELWCLTARCRL